MRCRWKESQARAESKVTADVEARFQFRRLKRETEMRGSVTRLNKKIGCGFIRGEDGLEAYFDLSSLEGIDIRALAVGRTVEYQEHFRHDRLRAGEVRMVPSLRGKSASGS